MSEKRNVFGFPTRATVRADDARAVGAALRDQAEAAERTPRVVFVDADVRDGDYPITVDAGMSNVAGVTAVATWAVDTEALDVATGVHWNKSDETAGAVRINDIAGLTSGTRYTVRFRIEGGR